MNAVNTFKSTRGNITKIEFTGSSSTNPISGFGENEGMTYSGNDGEWNGCADEITLVTRVRQPRASKIVVTVAGPANTSFLLDAPLMEVSNDQLFPEIKISME